MRSLACLLAALASLLVALAPAGLGGCGGGAPRVSLQQLMYKVDWEAQRLQAALGRGDLREAATAASTLQSHLEDPTVEGWLQRPRLPASPELFREHRAAFLAALQRVASSVDAGDLGAANMAYARLRMQCEVCHRDFRPGI